MNPAQKLTRHYLRHIISLIAIAAISLPLLAAEKEIPFSLSGRDARVISGDNGYDRIWLRDGQDGIGEPGNPNLPVKAMKVLIPANATLTGVKIADPAWRPLADKASIGPIQAPYPLSIGPQPTPDPPNPAVYGSDAPFPADPVVKFETHLMRGRQFVSVLVCPFRYQPLSGSLEVLSAATVILSYSDQSAPAPAAGGVSPAPAPAPAVTAPRHSAKADALFRDPLLETVVNPEDDASTAAPAMDYGNEQPLGGICDYLIITNADLSDEFAVLAAHRQSYNGYTTEIKTVASIASSYSRTKPNGGADDQTAIRNCVRDYIQNKGTIFVVLGGDNTIVPDRDTFHMVGTSDTSTMPTDLYYAGVDNTVNGTTYTDAWDMNGDGTYGKSNYNGTSADEGDRVPDVIVGRIPVRTGTQATNYINKLIDFENNPPAADFGGRTLLTGVEAWNTWTGESRGTDTVNDGHYQFTEHDSVSDVEQWLRRIYRDHVQNQPGYSENSLKMFFDTITSWDSPGAANAGDYPQTEANLVAKYAEDDGWMHSIVFTHGDTDKWCCEGSEYLYNSTALSMTGRTVVLNTCSCLTGAFDDSVGSDETFLSPAEPCLSEAFLRNPNGGAIAYIGCSRYGWGSTTSYYGGSSSDYIRTFYDRMFGMDYPVVGEALMLSKLDMIDFCTSENSYWWIQCGLNMQGDPAFAVPSVPFLAVESFSPVNGAVSVTTTDNLDIEFRQNVAKGASGNITIYEADGSVFEQIPVTDARVSVSGDTATINPAADLAADTVYYVLIDSGSFESSDGSVIYTGISDQYKWRFSTYPYLTVGAKGQFKTVLDAYWSENSLTSDREIVIIDPVHTENNCWVYDVDYNPDYTITIRGLGPKQTIWQSSYFKPDPKSSTGNDKIPEGRLLYVTCSNLVIKDITFRHGRETIRGGGVYTEECDNILIENCNFTDNCVGGYIEGRFQYGEGGGLQNRLTFESFTLKNCAFTGNYASLSGSGAYVLSSRGNQIVNCTFNANRNRSALKLAGLDSAVHNSFIVNNENVGLALDNVGCEADSCVIYGNGGTGTDNPATGARKCDDVFIDIFNHPQGGLLSTSCVIGDSDFSTYYDAEKICESELRPGSSGNIFGVNPQLGPFADYGGPTRTFSLLKDSIAINNGNNAVNATDDQRGYTRPVGNPDIGAYEKQIADPVTVVTDDDIVEVTEGASSNLRIRLSAKPAGTVQVSVQNINGDSDLSVSGASSFNFNATNWDAWQTVAIAAAADPDDDYGAACFILDADNAADTHFIAIETESDRTLTLVGGAYGLTSPEGMVAVTAAQMPYAITATPKTGYDFDQWTVTSGSATITDPNDPTTTVSLNSSAIIAASFVPSSPESGGVMLYDQDTFTESGVNDGRIDNSAPVLVTLAGDDTFTGCDGDDFVSFGKVTSNLASVAPGLSLKAVRINSNQVELTIEGNASSHADGDDTSALAIEFHHAAFSSGDAWSFTDYLKEGLAINFHDPSTPGDIFVSQSSGDDNTGDGSAAQPYASIARAVAAASDGDVIQIMDACHTENGIAISGKSLTVQGVAANITTLQAHYLTGVADDRVFDVAADAGLTLRNLRVSNGNCLYEGGAIRGYGDINIEFCELENNQFSGTYGPNARGGGTIAMLDGTLTIDSSAILDSTSYENGGAILCLENAGQATIKNSTFYRNYCYGNGYGGGVCFNPSAPGATLDIYNSTFASNDAGTSGGAVYIGAGTMNLRSSIIAGNYGSYGNDIYKAGSSVINDLKSLIGCNSNNGIATGLPNANGSYVGGSFPGIDPKYEASPGSPAEQWLRYNGGTTRNIAIADPASYAINHGENPLALTNDQRGAARVSGAAADIGAYEYQQNYTLTVENGTGDGNYARNTVVNINADAAPSGMVFSHWAGDITYLDDGFTNAANSVTMPNMDILLTATYKDNDAIVSIQSDRGEIPVPEGCLQTFNLRLSNQPSGTKTVSVARISGDTDISVNSGASLSFTTGNWDTWQTVTLAAAEDGDTTDGAAVIRCSASGLANLDLDATEVDYGASGHSVSFATDGTPGASLSGTTAQTVADGGNSAAVTANAPGGFHFVNWTINGSEYTKENPAAIANVTGDIAVTANFAADGAQFTVSFVTDGTPGATISGPTSQTVDAGDDCDPVQANAPDGWVFTNWTLSGSEYGTDSILTVQNVLENMTLTANFAVYVPPAVISIADDGLITEGAENGEVITVTLSDATFAGTLTPENWTVSNLPAGVAKGAVNRVGDTTATITLSGNRTADYDIDITSVTVSITADEHSASNAPSDSTGVTLTANVETLSYSGSAFNEAAANNGSIDNTAPVVITLAGAEFTGSDSDDFVADGKIIVSNLPSGLTAAATRTDSTHLSVTITGSADSHESADSVADLTFSFQDNAFSGCPAAFITNRVKSNLAVDFDDSTTTVTLNPTRDCQVDSGNADTNYGSADSVQSQGNNTNTYQKMTLAAFDLSGIAADSTVNSATLRVYCASESATKGGFARIFGLNDPWTEDGATYNRYDGTNAWTGGNANGSLDATAATPDNDTYENLASVDGSSNPVPTPPYQPGAFPNDDWGTCWIEFDVTSLVQDWVDGSRSNHGLAVCSTGYVGSHEGAVADPNYGYNLLTWHSRENSNQPELSVTYEGAPPVPALSYSAAAFNEAEANDGSIDNTTPVVITLENDSFTGSNGENFAANGKITVTNLPAGLSAVASRTDSAHLSVTITGTAAAHANTDDVADLTFSFQDSAFSGGDASAVTNAVKSDLAVNFDDPDTSVWDAYHALYSNFTYDTGTVTGGCANATPYTLKNHETGANLAATVTVSDFGTVYRQNRGAEMNPAPGTDANEIFNGVITIPTSGDNVAYGGSGANGFTYSFSNLQAGAKYTAAFFVNRGGDYGNTRATLGDASAYTAAHSAGVGGGSDADAADEDADYAANNTTNGYLFKWTDIEPSGSGGTSFTVSFSVQSGYVYAPACIMLSEQISATPASIAISDDGLITEGYEDGEIITVTLSDATFAGTLTPANWTLSNLPVGVSKGVVTRIGDTTATIALSGDRAADYDSDITSVTVECAAAEHSGSGDISANTGVTLTARNEIINYSGAVFTESGSDDGSISNTLTLTLSDDSFAADVVSGGHVSASNVPVGLSASFVRNSGTEISFSLTGNAASHANADDIATLTVSFDDSAFDGGPASYVTNSTKSNLEVDFSDASSADYTVGVAGDYPTIALALADCSGGEVIEIIDAVHTEAGITVDQAVTIQGLGADNTIVQAHATQGSASNRVFNVITTGAIIADMTIRHGNVAGDGGGILTTADLTISGCEIVDNDSTGGNGGGGVAVNGGYLTIIDSTIAGNVSAMRGGGVMFFETTGGTLENCTIADNTGNRAHSAAGGGVYVYDNGVGSITVDIVNCTISGNSAPNGGGGGVNSWNQTVNLVNTIITDNTASSSPSVYRGGDGAAVTDSYCVIGDNSGNDFIAGQPNANGSVIGVIGTPVSADLVALAYSPGAPTRTMAPNGGSPALRLIPRGEEPSYNDSPERDQRGFFINTVGHDDYNARTCGAHWDAATATPARGFRGWLR